MKRVTAADDAVWSFLAAVSCGAAAVTASAQAPADTPEPPPAEQSAETEAQPRDDASENADAPDPNVLAGPEVEEDTTDPDRLTLVKRDFDGSVERIRGMHEVAALDLLGLDEAERSTIDERLGERGAMVDRFAVDNIALLDRMRAAMGQRPQDRAERRERMELFRAFRDTMQPILDRGSMRDEIAGMLSDDDERLFLRLVGEYEETLEAERRGGGMPAMGMDDDREQSERRQRMRARLEQRLGPEGALGIDRRDFQALARELGASLRGVVETTQYQLNAMLDAVDATPEQRSEFQRIVQQFNTDRANADADDPIRRNPEQARRARLAEAMQMLTPEQRRKLAEYMGGFRSR